MTEQKKPNILKLKLNPTKESVSKPEVAIEKTPPKVEEKEKPIKTEASSEISYSQQLAQKKAQEQKDKAPALQGMPKIIERKPTRTTTFSQREAGNRFSSPGFNNRFKQGEFKPGEGHNNKFGERRPFTPRNHEGGPRENRFSDNRTSERGEKSIRETSFNRPQGERLFNRPGGNSGPFNRPNSGGPGSFNRPGGNSGPFNRSSTGGPSSFNRNSGGPGSFNRPGGNSGPFNRSSTGGPGSFNRNSGGPGSFNRPGGNSGPFNRPSSGPRPFSFTPVILPEKKSFDDKRKKRNNDNDDRIKQKSAIFKNTNSNINVTDFVGRIDSNHLDAHGFHDTFAKKRKDKPKIESAQFIKRDIEIAAPMSIKDISTKMAIRSDQVRAVAKQLGLNANEKENISEDILHIIVEECGHNPIRLDEQNKALLEFPKLELDPAKSKPRPPVVVVVGHVDHGKTSLLDRIRKSNIAKGEAGGITQNIGAYQIATKEGAITFIDTPGHEAFTSMRARGVKITDIAILVVSSQDSIKPQTIEAITHIKAADVPIIVAITKSDLPSANIEKVKNDLLTHEIVVEDFGGAIPCVAVSALTGDNIDKLLQTIILQAEVMELKAQENLPARGIVLESKINPKIGPVTTLLIQQGTLKTMSFCIAQVASGKIKAMHDAQGNALKEAKPSMPVEVIGFDIAPPAGSEFAVIEDKKIAAEILEARKLKHDQETKSAGMSISMEAFGVEASPSINLILRSDTQGSLEALKLALTKLNSAQAEAKFVLAGIGPIKESDIDLAVISDASIVSFNVKNPSNIKKIAEEKEIKIIENSIIYHLIEQIEQELLGLIKPEEKEVWSGSARIQQIFTSSKLGNIAGCIVTSGSIKNGMIAKVLRNGKEIISTKISSLKRNKDDVKEVKNGLECGIVLENFDKLQVDDEIQCYKIEIVQHVPRETSNS